MSGVRKRRFPGERTKAEMLAHIRNWKIRQLRGLYTNADHLITDPINRVSILTIIDAELESLGAETELDRRTRKALEEHALDIRYTS